MKFTFEEVELINSCFDEDIMLKSRGEYITQLTSIRTNVEDETLNEIINNVIEKFYEMKEIDFIKMVNDLPISVFEEY